jgi:N-methylhydantoinase A
MAVMLVNLRTVAVGQRNRSELPHSASQGSGAPRVWQRRRVHFNGWYDTPIYQRADLAPGMHFDGPAIVEQSDTTTVVEPGMDVTVDAKGNLLVKVK